MENLHLDVDEAQVVPPDTVHSAHRLFHFRAEDEAEPRFVLDFNPVKEFLKTKYRDYFATYLRILNALISCQQMSATVSSRFDGAGVYFSDTIASVGEKEHLGALVFYANLAHTGPVMNKSENAPFEYTISYFMRGGDMWYWPLTQYSGLNGSTVNLMTDRLEQTSIRTTIASGVVEPQNCMSVYEIASIIFHDIYPFLFKTKSIEGMKEYYTSQIPLDNYQANIEFFHFLPLSCKCDMCTVPLQRGFPRHVNWANFFTPKDLHVLRVMFMTILESGTYMNSSPNTLFYQNYFENTTFSPWENYFPLGDLIPGHRGHIFAKYHFEGLDFPYLYIQMNYLQKTGFAVHDRDTVRASHPVGPDLFFAEIMIPATHAAHVPFEHWYYGVPSRHMTNGTFRLEDLKCPSFCITWSQIDLENPPERCKDEHGRIMQEYYFKRTLFANMDADHFSRLHTESVMIELVLICQRMQYYCTKFRAINGIMDMEFAMIEKLIPLAPSYPVKTKRKELLLFYSPEKRKRFKGEEVTYESYGLIHNSFNFNVDVVGADPPTPATFFPIRDLDYMVRTGITRPVHTAMMDNRGLMYRMDETDWKRAAENTVRQNRNDPTSVTPREWNYALRLSNGDEEETIANYDEGEVFDFDGNEDTTLETLRFLYSEGNFPRWRNL